jgi:hypothetical protein
VSRFASVVAGVVCVTLSAMVWAECVGMPTHAAARACCAKKYRCTGSTRPDNCCKTMKGGTGRQAVATVTPQRPAPAPQFVAVDRARVAIVAAFETRHQYVAARLHDPPHLHAFSLLI